MVAVTRVPGGAVVTASPWDIQTCWLPGCPAKRVLPVSVTAAVVSPYSRAPVRATWPPSAWAIAWKP